MKKENWMLSWMSKGKKVHSCAGKALPLWNRKELEPGLTVRSIIRLTEGKWVADNKG